MLNEIFLPEPLLSLRPSSPPLVTTEDPLLSIRIITPGEIMPTGFPSIDISNWASSVDLSKRTNTANLSWLKPTVICLSTGASANTEPG